MYTVTLNHVCTLTLFHNLFPTYTHMYTNAHICMHTAPSAPRNVMAANISSTAISVQWITPASPRGTIDFYFITYYETELGEEDSRNVSVDGDVTSVDISGLSEYTNYSVYVQAETVALGDRSETVTVFTDEDRKCMCTCLYVLCSEAKKGICTCMCMYIRRYSRIESSG